jgi:hypothetical protein
MRRNRRNAAAFNVEREHLQDLPLRRTTDFVEEEARVTRCGTFTVRGILYSAPSRLIGHRLKVRVYPERIDCYLSGALVHSTARGSHAANSRRRALDYRHFVDALKRKPQAFKGKPSINDALPMVGRRSDAKCPRGHMHSDRDDRETRPSKQTGGWPQTGWPAGI